jgi:hypothetical protein
VFAEKAAQPACLARRWLAPNQARVFEQSVRVF